MTIIELQELIKEEIRIILKSESLSEAEEWMTEDAILLGELLNPDKSYNYTGSKGWFTYLDSMNNTFFVRLAYQPLSTGPYFELKTGWYDEEGVPHYDPAVPPNSTAMDWDKRSDTVAKIYRDEILPFFKRTTLSDILMILPISVSRYQFSIRLVDKFTPKEFKVEKIPQKKIIITKTK